MIYREFCILFSGVTVVFAQLHVGKRKHKPGFGHDTRRSGIHCRVTFVETHEKFRRFPQHEQGNHRSTGLGAALADAESPSVVLCLVTFEHADMKRKKRHRSCIQYEGRKQVRVVSCFRNAKPESHLLTAD
jgi:hypothetical protein